MWRYFKVVWGWFILKYTAGHIKSRAMAWAEEAAWPGIR
jgi:hypothetical protein